MYFHFLENSLAENDIVNFVPICYEKVNKAQFDCFYSAFTGDEGSKGPLLHLADMFPVNRTSHNFGYLNLQ